MRVAFLVLRVQAAKKIRRLVVIPAYVFGSLDRRQTCPLRGLRIVKVHRALAFWRRSSQDNKIRAKFQHEVLESSLWFTLFICRADPFPLSILFFDELPHIIQKHTVFCLSTKDCHLRTRASYHGCVMHSQRRYFSDNFNPVPLFVALFQIERPNVTAMLNSVLS